MPIVKHDIGVITGATFQLPAGTTTDLNKVLVHREGSLVPWHANSLTRSGNTCTITPELDQEFIYVIVFT